MNVPTARSRPMSGIWNPAIICSLKLSACSITPNTVGTSCRPFASSPMIAVTPNASASSSSLIVLPNSASLRMIALSAFTTRAVPAVTMLSAV